MLMASNADISCHLHHLVEVLRNRSNPSHSWIDGDWDGYGNFVKLKTSDWAKDNSVLGSRATRLGFLVR